MSPSKSKKIPYLILSTAANQAEAKKIAAVLVRKKLAACVNVVPGLKSYFRWKGKLDRANEVLLVIKTSRRQLKAVEAQIRKLHPYSVPEVIGMPIRYGSKPYLDWLSGSVS